MKLTRRALLALAQGSCAAMEEDPNARVCELGELELGTCPDEAASASPCDGNVTVDVHSLLGEMTDLGRLSRRGCPPYTTHEASSTDRSSVAPEPPRDDQEGWYANRDWGNYLRVEPRTDEYVMLDVQGPGAIVRDQAVFEQ